MDTNEVEIKHNHTKRILLATALTAGALTLSALWFVKEWLPYVRTNDATIQSYTVSVAPDLPGRIVEVLVDDGDYVQQGQLLALIDGSFLIQSKVKAEASIQAIENKIVYQEYHLKKIKHDYERALKAYEDSVISFQDFDHKSQDLGMAEAKLSLAKANLEVAKKELAEIQEKIQHTRILAPRSGIIAKRWVLAGDVLSPGQTMFTLNDLSAVWVLANLEENKIAHVKIGSPVEINIDAYNGKKLTGKVFSINGAAASQFSLLPQDNATGNYTKVAQRVPIRITIDPPSWSTDEKPYFFPGLSAEVKIRVKE